MPLLRLESQLGSAQTFTAIYRLNLSAPGAVVLVDRESRRATNRNRGLIPAQLWKLERPNWSRR